mmetsp:Transcript_25194/g.72878  ORF Transcript_25194/g.72878 Transcript_25194/m.72878 type:complete len:278 (-) Transcript_25194:16-849(-)
MDEMGTVKASRPPKTGATEAAVPPVPSFLLGVVKFSFLLTSWAPSALVVAAADDASSSSSSPRSESFPSVTSRTLVPSTADPLAAVPVRSRAFSSSSSSSSSITMITSSSSSSSSPSFCSSSSTSITIGCSSLALALALASGCVSSLPGAVALVDVTEMSVALFLAFFCCCCCLFLSVPAVLFLPVGGVGLTKEEAAEGFTEDSDSASSTLPWSPSSLLLLSTCSSSSRSSSCSCSWSWSCLAGRGGSTLGAVDVEGTQNASDAALEGRSSRDCRLA